MLSIFYFTFFLAIGIFELTRKKLRLFDYLTLFNIYFVIYYLLPAFVINFSSLHYISRYYKYLGSIDGTLQAAILIMFSYIMVIAGYYFARSKFRKNIPNKNVKVGFANKNLAPNKNENRLIRKVNYILLIVGFVSLIIYGGMFGSVKQLLLYTGDIRNGILSFEGDSTIAFVRRFIIALMYPSFFIFIQYMKNKKEKGKLILSFLLAILWLTVNAGRGAVLQYILILYLSYILIKDIRKINLFGAIVLAAIMFIGVNYLRPIFTNLMYLQEGLGVFWGKFISESTSGRYLVDGIQDIFFNFVYYLDHKYISLEVAIQAVNSGTHHMNFFYEIFIALISLIPSKFLFFSKPESIIFYNTLYITGNYASTIPPGGIALGYYSLSWAGVILFSFFIGIIGRKLNNFFIRSNSYYSEILYVATMFFWLDLFFAGELRQTLQRFFVYGIMLIYVGVKSKKWQKSNA